MPVYPIRSSAWLDQRPQSRARSHWLARRDSELVKAVWRMRSGLLAVISPIFFRMSIAIAIAMQPFLDAAVRLEGDTEEM